MEKKDIQRVTPDDVWAMILTSWQLVKFNYGLTVVIGFVLGFATFLSATPFLGALIGGAVNAITPLVFLKAAKEWENSRESSVNQLIEHTKNKELLNRMFPLLLIQFTLFAGPQLLAQIPYMNVMFGSIGIFTLPVSIVVGVAYPILFFNPEINYQKTLSLSLDGIIMNIGPFLIGACMLIALLAVSTLLFLIPLFIVGLPVFFVFQYVWYRVVYEGMAIEVPDKTII